MVQYDCYPGWGLWELGCVSRPGDPGDSRSRARGTCCGGTGLYILWPPLFRNSFFPNLKWTDWEQATKTLSKVFTMLPGPPEGGSSVKLQM